MAQRKKIFKTKRNKIILNVISMGSTTLEKKSGVSHSNFYERQEAKRNYNSNL